VDRLLPFHCTPTPDTKFDPFTVRVKAVPPRVAVFGEIVAIVGTGLGGGGELPPVPQPHILIAESTIRVPAEYLAGIFRPPVIEPDVIELRF
jgi:hypothetical protein